MRLINGCGCLIVSQLLLAALHVAAVPIKSIDANEDDRIVQSYRPILGHKRYLDTLGDGQLPFIKRYLDSLGGGHMPIFTRRYYSTDGDVSSHIPAGSLRRPLLAGRVLSEPYHQHEDKDDLALAERYLEFLRRVEVPKRTAEEIVEEKRYLDSLGGGHLPLF